MGILGMARNFYGLMKRSIDSTKVFPGPRSYTIRKSCSDHPHLEQIGKRKNSDWKNQVMKPDKQITFVVTSLCQSQKFHHGVNIFKTTKNPFQKRCQKKILRHLNQSILNLPMIPN